MSTPSNVVILDTHCSCHPGHSSFRFSSGVGLFLSSFVDVPYAHDTVFTTSEDTSEKKTSTT